MANNTEAFWMADASRENLPIDFMAENVIGKISDQIEGLSPKQIADAINQTMDQFSKHDPFIQWVMFDYLQNMVKPRIIDGHFGKDEFISLLQDFTNSYGTSLNKYLDEKMRIEEATLKELS